MPQKTAAWCRRCVALLIALAGGIVHAGAAEPAAAPPVMLDDARLCSIAFIDPDRGWAVGERGVIWQTIDGGRSWRLQPAGVTATLHCVHFADTRHGWIVGGWPQPYTHGSSGVVLRTLDGGATWERTPNVILPELKQVRFFDPQQGVAVGNSSPLFPSGIFRTTDGGRSWTPLPATEPRRWTAGDFLSLEQGSVAGTDGQMAVVAYSRTTPSRTPDVGPRTLRKVQLRGPRGWLVGDGGLVMCSDDGGTSWRFPDGPLPEGTAEYFDPQAITTLGPHVWIVGAPGSVVLHTADSGRTWERLVTDSPVPLHDVTFLDERRGWAVGSLGTILATRDGGRSWRLARGIPRRLALLGLVSDAEAAPWELFVQSCASEGYLGGLEQLVRPLLAPGERTRASHEDRLVAAVSSAGGSAAGVAWNFPGVAPGLGLPVESVEARWNALNDGQGVERMRELLVRRIRQWRPDVVITDSTDPSSEDATGRMLAQLVVEAAQRAGEPTSYPDHAALAGLTPWRVSKVYSLTTPSTATAVRLNTLQLAANLGMAVRDFAVPARGLLRTEFVPAPQQLGFRLLVNRLPQDVGRTDVFSGLNLPPSSQARRPSLDVPLENLEKLRRLTQQRQNVEQLIARAEDDGAAWLGQLEDLTRGFAPATSGTVLYQLALRYQAQGHSEMAAEVLQRLLQDLPEHDLADSARRWLIQYYASSEMAWRLARSTRFQSQVVAAQYNPEAVEPQAADAPRPAVQTAAGLVAGPAITAAAPLEGRYPRALELGHSVLRTRPVLYADPALRFPLAVCQRLQGFGREVEHYLHQVAAVADSPAWQQAALGELWLRHASGTPPKPVTSCSPAAGRPHLDGKLDDAVWQNVRPMALRLADGQPGAWPSEVKLAYDEQFLYIAAHCVRATQCEYPRSDEPRPRDPDLASRDRVEILLDLDRDYATYYRLTIDHRGWPRDECWGDVTWDPQWFVAQSEDEHSWTVEAAIAWSELGPQPAASKAAWALGVQRIAPRAGLQAWTWPAAVQPQPEGFGLLVFE